MIRFLIWKDFRTVEPPLITEDQGDFRLSVPPSCQGASDEARTCDRSVPANLRADSLATVPPTPSHKQMTDCSV
ncbi:hypothetical protein PoB_003168400 [Plakobranchus ocellatus]|uniref:Uncharacterized protein n=1 Tax=Plakobranchus ocellatus TaxID=259542 RepID=A0AAV4AC19_9GAST|nr:hypothetical protein PoB_003168400 [Plakobranchus ocellatus]